VEFFQSTEENWSGWLKNDEKLQIESIQNNIQKKRVFLSRKGNSILQDEGNIETHVTRYNALQLVLLERKEYDTTGMKKEVTTCDSGDDSVNSHYLHPRHYLHDLQHARPALP
jgi:hypothetical protein